MLPDRNRLLPLIRAFFNKNTENLASMHVYFTREGIRRFARTGLLKEIPSDFYRPFLSCRTFADASEASAMVPPGYLPYAETAP